MTPGSNQAATERAREVLAHEIQGWSGADAAEKLRNGADRMVSSRTAIRAMITFAAAEARLSDGRVEDRVLLWSGEHHAYWRPNSAGYTTDGLGAGLYSREEAERIVRGCDADKKVSIREIDRTWPLLAALTEPAPSHPERVTVTQADREAAARYERLTCPPVAEVIVNGDADDMQLVQFFARHAQAAREAERERCAAVAAEVGARADALALKDPTDARVAIGLAGEAIAAAIRALQGDGA